MENQNHNRLENIKKVQELYGQPYNRCRQQVHHWKYLIFIIGKWTTNWAKIPSLVNLVDETKPHIVSYISPNKLISIK